MNNRQIEYLIETLEQISKYKRLSRERYLVTITSKEFESILSELREMKGGLKE